MKNGTYFYQNYTDVNLIDGSYALKTSSGDYYAVNYAIENPFQGNSNSNFKGKIIQNIYYYSEIGRLSVKNEEKIEKYFYTFFPTGLKISSKYLKKCKNIEIILK